jgi:hypothetical protein
MPRLPLADTRPVAFNLADLPEEARRVRRQSEELTALATEAYQRGGEVALEAAMRRWRGDHR